MQWILNWIRCTFVAIFVRQSSILGHNGIDKNWLLALGQNLDFDLFVGIIWSPNKTDEHVFHCHSFLGLENWYDKTVFLHNHCANAFNPFQPSIAFHIETSHLIGPTWNATLGCIGSTSEAQTPEVIVNFFSARKILIDLPRKI